MAGQVIPMVMGGDGREESMVAVGGHWEVHYARFFTHPSRNQAVSPSSSTTTSAAAAFASFVNRTSLSPIQRRRSPGTWISSSASSSSANLYILSSGHGSVLSVYFRGKMMEEHFITKLHFTWPQVSCVSGFPTRGSLVVFVTYKDCMDKLQKFALRFSTVNDTNSFVKCLEDSLFRKKDISSEPSFLSSPSQFVTPYRPDDMSRMISIDASEVLETAPINTSQPQRNLHSEVKELSYFHDNHVANVNYVADVPPNNFVDGLGMVADFPANKSVSGPNMGADLPAFPPRFTSLVTNCSSQIEQGNEIAVLSNTSEEVEIKAQIEKYMQDASFLDILTKVEKVINDLGGRPVTQFAGA